MKSKESYHKHYKIFSLLLTLVWWNFGFRILVFLRFAGSDSNEIDGISKALLIFHNSFLSCVLFASVMGFLSWLFERVIFSRMVLKAGNVKASMLRGIFYFSSISLVSLAANYYHYMVEKNYSFLESSSFLRSFIFNETWLFFLIIGFFINVTLNMFVAAENHLGNGNLWRIITGRFQQPKEENRIFMFLDLVSSSRTAEILGHEKYSYFIQDCFRQLSNVILRNAANVYQYVGDEVVLTWNADNSKNFWRSANFYFEFIDRLRKKENYFQDKYGLLPQFKASLNCGKVMVAEVGEIKSEIAYHGDVLNTASKVQKICKNYNEDIIVTEPFVNEYQKHSSAHTFNFIGRLEFSGKKRKVSVFSVTDGFFKNKNVPS